MRVLLVCLGNICRSPTAEAALRVAAEDAGLDLEIDSAGTGAWHVGEPPDPRMVAAGREAGLHLDGAARQVTADDLEDHDLVLAMDAENLEDLRRLAPPGTEDRIRRFREFDPEADGDLDVPDPYYGGEQGFHRVVEIVQRTARALVAAIGEGRL